VLTIYKYNRVNLVILDESSIHCSRGKHQFMIKMFAAYNTSLIRVRQIRSTCKFYRKQTWTRITWTKKAPGKLCRRVTLPSQTCTFGNLNMLTFY